MRNTQDTLYFIRVIVFISLIYLFYVLWSLLSKILIYLFTYLFYSLCNKSAGLSDADFESDGRVTVIESNRATKKCIAEVLFLSSSWAPCNSLNLECFLYSSILGTYYTIYQTGSSRIRHIYSDTHSMLRVGFDYIDLFCADVYTSLRTLHAPFLQSTSTAPIWRCSMTDWLTDWLTDWAGVAL